MRHDEVKYHHAPHEIGLSYDYFLRYHSYNDHTLELKYYPAIQLPPHLEHTQYGHCSFHRYLMSRELW
jgi:hypothetical protein